MSASPRPFAPLDLLQLLAVAMVWGLNNVATKIAVTAFPPMLTATFRFSLVLTCLVWFIKPLPREHWRGMAVLVASLGAVHFALIFTGFHLATHFAPMVVAAQLFAPAAVVLSVLILRERVAPLRWLGVALSFAGVLLLAFDPVVFAQGWALLAVIAAAIIYGLGTVMVRVVGPVVGPFALQGWIALAGVPAMALGTLLFEHGQWQAVTHAPLYAWGCLLFGGVVSAVIANGVLAKLMHRYGVSRTTPYLLTAPAISFLLSPIVLGDELTWRIVAGGVIVMSGVALVALADRHFNAPVREAA